MRSATVDSVSGRPSKTAHTPLFAGIPFRLDVCPYKRTPADRAPSLSELDSCKKVFVPDNQGEGAENRTLTLPLVPRSETKVTRQNVR